jgi:Kdo2-lipid IVA lauroyltransferase/acyltransferase
MPELTDLRHRLEYALLRVIVFIVRLFPLDMASAFSARAWQLLAPYGKRQRRALANIARAFPDMPEAERRRIIKAMWGNLGRVMAETMQMDRILAEPSRMEFVSAKLFERYRGKMGPAVGVTLHMGNWELATWPMTLTGWHPAAVYRLVKNPYVDRYIRDQRRDLFPGGLFAKGRASNTDHAEGQRTARQILDFVRKGGRLGIVSDLYDHFGIEVPFFGHMAKTTPAPAMVARRVGSRIWMGRCIRVGQATRFKLEFKELKVQRTANQGDDIRATTAAMQAQFEEWIREYPEQWMWSNRRWS